MRPLSVSYGRRCARGSMTPSLSPPTTRHSTAMSWARVAPHRVFARLDCRSPAPSDWPARNGESTQPRCQTSAATFELHCVTMTRNPMRRRVRASYSRPKLRAGTCAEDRLTIRAAMASCRRNRMGEIYNFAAVGPPDVRLSIKIGVRPSRRRVEIVSDPRSWSMFPSVKGCNLSRKDDRQVPFWIIFWSPIRRPI